MPGWVLNIILAVGGLLILLVFGSDTAVTIFLLMFVWFAALGVFVLGIETLIQAIGRRLRRQS